MPFPKNMAERIAAGYVLKRKSHCRGCGAAIEWWLTPRGKMMPLDVDTHEPHWSTCPKAQEFRRRS